MIDVFPEPPSPAMASFVLRPYTCPADAPAASDGVSGESPSGAGAAKGAIIAYTRAGPPSTGQPSRSDVNENRSFRSEDDEPKAKPDWRVDAEASLERLRNPAADDRAPQAGAGRLLYTDEQGAQRRLPADMSELSRQEVVAAAKAMSYELGAVEPSYAQIVAIERLNELRASGAWSEEDYLREKRRILGQD